jgi:bifunctional non-homologous end joining protein LigD
MLATADALPHAPGWVYEVKWDGIRLVVTAQGGRASLASRNGLDHTGRWPEIAPIAAQLPPGRTVLDGELVAFDDAGRPSFTTLMGSRRHDIALCLFDVMALDGRDTTRLPWTQRRALLEALRLDGPHWRTPEVFDDGDALLAATAAGGLEGVVAKRRDATYQPGVRSRDWVKVAHRRTTSVVVGGWQPGGADGLKSLAVGVPRGRVLTPAGSVGSGISAREASALLAVLADLASDRCPFDPVPKLPDARWVEPLLVVDVEHLGHTEGATLRQAVFVRVRPDLTPDDLAVPGG